MQDIRMELLEREEKILSPLACKARYSKGREEEEKEDEFRTIFMRDRDRIIHSKAFRRLKHKTQVYISPENDHYRTRLTHTLEVAQIGKTIGRALFLNEDLLEAIALGHDVGHTPFAHCGESVLNELVPGGFKHNLNSIRVLKEIESHGERRGLNLSYEVLDGIRYHSGFSKAIDCAHTLEGQIIRFADKIAYVQHDIDDSIRAGILNEEDLPKEAVEVLGHNLGDRITTLVQDLILEGRKIPETEKTPILTFSAPINEALVKLRAFMFKEIYNGEICRLERERATFVVSYLYEYFLKHYEEMPLFYQDIVKRDGLEIGVCDYISGMTDNYCIYLFKSLTIPRSFVSVKENKN